MAAAQGFDAFFDAEYDGIVRALTLAFGDRYVAEDAAQVGFERAFARWRSVALMERPATWVYVVAVRHGRRDLHRTSNRTAERPVDSCPGPEEQVVDTVWMMTALRGLPPRQRAAVVLRHLGGLQLAEVADALGIRIGTLKSTLHAAYRNLRVEIGSDAPELESDHAR